MNRQIDCTVMSCLQTPSFLAMARIPRSKTSSLLIVPYLIDDTTKPFLAPSAGGIRHPLQGASDRGFRGSFQ
jgi:hypothetical protein